MMKWGRRKTSSASSSASGPSFMSHASPFSWLSKFKQMRINSEPNQGKMKHKAKENSTSVGSPQYSCGNIGGGFYVGDGDALWRTRLSFSEENYEDKKSEDVEEDVIASSNFLKVRRNAKKQGTRESTVKFKEKDIGLGEERKLLNDRKVPVEMNEYNRENEYELLRRRFERKAQEVLQEQLLKLEREAAEAEFASSKIVEKDVLQLDSPRTICTPRTHSFPSFADSSRSSSTSKVRTIVDFYEKKGRQNSQKKSSSERQNLKQIEELKVKTNKKKQTQDFSREVQRRKPKQSSSRVRIYSPRIGSKVEVCRIKALEDMRKSKLKMKKEREGVFVEEKQGSSDSFAVIKCSLDPKQDFRDSMIEMIMENQIKHPEEMEELLACYLALNAVEYHDLIIKVFRKLWFDMSQGGLGLLPNMQCACCE